MQPLVRQKLPLSSYNFTFGTLPGQPVWAVAENYRFEPGLVEVLVNVILDVVSNLMFSMELILVCTGEKTGG